MYVAVGMDAVSDDLKWPDHPAAGEEIILGIVMLAAEVQANSNHKQAINDYDTEIDGVQADAGLNY